MLTNQTRITILVLVTLLVAILGAIEAHAFTQVQTNQHTLKEDNFYTGGGSNYATRVGFQPRVAIYSANTFYIPVCANSFPATATAEIVNQDDQVVATAETVKLELCSEMNASSTNPTDWATFQFENPQQIGTSATTQNSFVVRVTGGKYYYSTEGVSSPNIRDTYFIWGCQSSEDCTDIHNSTDYPIFAFSNQQPIQNPFERGGTLLNSATITASSTLTVDVNYTLDQTEYSGQNDRPDTIVVNVSNNDTTQFEQKQAIILPVDSKTSNEVLNFETPMPNGEYTVSIFFWNFTQQAPVFTNSFLSYQITIESGQVTDSTLVDEGDGTFPSTNNYEDCTGFDFYCHGKNLLTLLLYPNDWSINYITSSMKNISDRIPFSYVTGLSDMVETLPYVENPSPPTIGLDIMGNEELEIISEGDYTLFIGGTVHTILYTIATGAIYLSLAVALWNLRKKLFSPTT